MQFESYFKNKPASWLKILFFGKRHLNFSFRRKTQPQIPSGICLISGNPSSTLIVTLAADLVKPCIGFPSTDRSQCWVQLQFQDHLQSLLYIFLHNLRIIYIPGNTRACMPRYNFLYCLHYKKFGFYSGLFRLLTHHQGTDTKTS